MTTVDRLAEFMRVRGLSAYQLERDIGASNGSIGKAIKSHNGIGSDRLETIVAKYKDLNPLWLISGEGQMLKSTPKSTPNSTPNSNLAAESQDSYQNSTFRLPAVITVDAQDTENILYVPVKAQAGYLIGHSDPEYIEELPAFQLPGYHNGTFRMFDIVGNSMLPTLHPSTPVIAEWVEQLNHIRNDRVYVIVTKDGVVIKRVLNRIEESDKLILKSDNFNEFETYSISPSEVIEAWYVKGALTRHLPPPTDTYKRVVDLEAITFEMNERLKSLEGN